MTNSQLSYAIDNFFSEIELNAEAYSSYQQIYS